MTPHHLLVYVTLLAVPRLHGQPEVFTTVAELRQLTPDQAAKGIPLRLEGVITSVDPTYFQDETGGTAFSGKWNIAESVNQDVPLRSGDAVTLEGTSCWNRDHAGISSPRSAHEIQIKVTGRAPYPEPRSIDSSTIDDLALNGQWVELEAAVSQSRFSWSALELTLRIENHFVAAKVRANPWDFGISPPFNGTVVRIRGVYEARFDSKGTFHWFNLHVPDKDCITVLDSSRVTAFSLPQVSLRDLGKFLPDQSRRIRVSGVVTWADNWSAYIEDGFSAGQINLPKHAPMPKSRECIEVVGFVGTEDGHPVLNDCIFRNLDGFSGSSVFPVTLPARTLATQPDFHGCPWLMACSKRSSQPPARSLSNSAMASLPSMPL